LWLFLFLTALYYSKEPKLMKIALKGYGKMGKEIEAIALDRNSYSFSDNRH
jgi:hypothetical protein